MIEAWFPTLIYRNNLGPVMNNEALYKKALELKKSKPGHNWDSGVYNSLDAVDIRNDPYVKEFITTRTSSAEIVGSMSMRRGTIKRFILMQILI